MGTTRNHEPLSGIENIDATTLNDIFSSLDSAIVSAVLTGTAGEALAERNFVYLASDGEWYKLDTDATGAIKAGRWIGCVTESGGISASGTGQIRLKGFVDGFTGLTALTTVWGSTTAGGYTQTKPAVTDGGGQVGIVELGFGVSTTQMYFDPEPIRYAKRETLADDGTLTIEHHANAQTRARRVRAYVGASYDEPLFIGSLGVSLQEVAVNYGDTSYTDEDTKTTFKNLTGASADIVCEVVI